MTTAVMLVYSGLAMMLTMGCRQAPQAFNCPDPAGEPVPGQTNRHKTDWMYEAKIGMSTHYIADGDNLQKLAGLFDAEKVADQLAYAGVGWFLFTLQHQNWALMAPNSTYDRVIGRTDLTAARDIPMDLIKALDPKGIKLMLYVNLRLDPKSVCPEDVRDRMGGWPPNDTLIANVAAVYREFSMRYGKHVAGWWVDGPHHPDIRYSDQREDWFAILGEAFRAGNPDAILAFNYSLIERWGMFRFSRQDDYTPGETDSLYYIPEDRWIDGAQCHIWTFLGEFWSQSGKRFEDSVITEYARRVTRNGGVLTLEAGSMARSGRKMPAGSDPNTSIGSIDPRQVEQVRRIVEAVRRSGN